MKIIWEENKNQENIKKHKVSFEEAEIIRIITARKATKNESKAYGGN
jgi:uncharacterized DUF497 family protein